MRAKNRHQQLTPSRSHQAGNTQHFSFSRYESNSIDEQLARHCRIFNRDVARFEHDFATLVCTLREYLADFASHHLSYHAGLIQVLCRVSADRAAVVIAKMVGDRK